MTAFATKYGSHALIAGASEGLGLAFAEQLALRGFDLTLLARRKEKLEEVAGRISAQHKVQVSAYTLDLSDGYAVQHFLSQEVHPDTSMMVYNAAYAPIGYFADMGVSDLYKVADVNIKGLLAFAHHFAAEFKTKKRGGIVLMSSLAGTQGTPKIATYAASKAFITNLAEGLWKELQPSGVDVIASVAGAIRTPGYKGAKGEKEAPGTMSAEDVANITLHALGTGPTVTPGLTNKFARMLMGRLLPRKTAISIMEKNTKDLS